jgi:hypothetical protein
MTGPLALSYANAQLIVGLTGNTVQTLRSTDGGPATLNMTSGSNTGQLVQTGTSFNFVNYAAGGVTSFSQAGDGQIRFFTNGRQSLTINDIGVSVGGNIFATGLLHSFQDGSIPRSAVAGLPSPATAPPSDPAATAQVGVSNLYARADHQHKLPTLAALGAASATHTHKLDDLTDVTVTTPAAGQTIRWNGSAFVNASLAYADLSGVPAPIAPSATAGLGDTAAGTVGTSALYARADHTHPSPPAVLPSQTVGLADTPFGGVGSSDRYARADHTHPSPAALPACNFYSTSHTINATDVGKLIVNNSESFLDITFSLPFDDVLPVGTRLDFVDGSSTCVTYIQAPPGGEIRYSSSLAVGGSGSIVTVFGSPTPGRVGLPTPFFRITAIKVLPNRWILFA